MFRDIARQLEVKVQRALISSIVANIYRRDEIKANFQLITDRKKYKCNSRSITLIIANDHRCDEEKINSVK